MSKTTEKSMNKKKHTLAKYLDSMLVNDPHPYPPRESVNWMGFAMAAMMVALIVVAIALGRAWDDNRRMSRQIGQLHQTK